MSHPSSAGTWFLFETSVYFLHRLTYTQCINKPEMFIQEMACEICMVPRVSTRDINSLNRVLYKTLAISVHTQTETMSDNVVLNTDWLHLPYNIPG